MPASVSVIIPTYNRRELLSRALDSVMRQTRPADEIIVVDDGSDDGTAEMVAQNYPTVICVQHQNHGISYSRNRGVDRATGTWIAFLDNDDVWLPPKLGLQLTALKEEPRYQLCHTEEIWIRNGRRVNPMNKHKKRGGDTYLDCLALCLISPSSVMMSREFFQQIGGFDESLPACEDYDLWLRICADNAVLYLEEPLLEKYGGHEDQLSKRFWGMDRFRVQALEKMLNSGCLQDEKLEATQAMLISKCQILVNGAVKRNNVDLAKTYSEKLSRYSDEPNLGLL